MGIKIWWPLLFVGSIIIASILIFPSDLRLADLLGRAGKFDEAIAKYESILDKDPSRTSARIQLAKLYIRNNQPEEAVREIEKVGAEHFEGQFFLMQIADIYSRLGNKEKTIETLEKIVRQDPYNLTYRRKLADAYDWNSETEKARVLYEALLMNNRKDAELLNKVVLLNLKQKRFKESLPYLNRLVALQPNNTRVRGLLADVYLELGNRQQAAQEFENILEIQPQNEPVRQRLADLYIWNQQFERGLSQYEYLLSRNPDSERYFERFTDLAYNLAPTKSIQFYRQRLERTPSSNRLREQLADLYLHIGDTDNAVQQLTVLIARNPDSAKYYQQLGYLYQDIRKPHQANRIFETMLEKGLDNEEVGEELLEYYHANKHFDKLLQVYPHFLNKTETNPQLLEDYARVLFQTRHYNKALEQYAYLVDRFPDNGDYRVNLAELYQFKQQDRKAIKVLWDGVRRYDLRDEQYLLYAANYFSDQKLVPRTIYCYQQLTALAPDNLQYKKQLVSYYVENRDFAKAIDLYRQIREHQPSNIAARFELASLYWRQGDFESMHKTLDEIRADLEIGYDTHKSIGQFFFERGFYNKAIQYLANALQIVPDDSVSLRMLALSCAWNNQPKQAMKVLKRYNGIYPDDFFTHFEMGALLFASSRYETADREFQVSLDLIAGSKATRESRVTQAKIYAYQKRRNAAIEAFESLVADYPGDVELYIDYAESLINLKEYKLSDHWLAHVLDEQPDHYRALRSQGRSFFERGKYSKSAAILRNLLKRYPDDMGLQIDLADTELADGDWYASTENLKEILRKYPKNSPAQQRLTDIRREQAVQLSADYESAKQSDNFIKQLYDIVVTKAKTSLLHIKLLFGEERYAAKDNSLPTQKYQNLSANLFSSFNKNLKTEVSAKVQQNGDNWYLATRGKVQWKFNPTNSVALSAELNDIWDDPFTAAFQKGRLNRYQTDLHLSLFRNLFVWNRFSYEQHSYFAGDYGKALRTYFQVGRRWKFDPQLAAYYQFYHLKYDFAPAADQNLIFFPEKDAIHYLGGSLEHRLIGQLLYQLDGSIGFSGVQNTVNLFGSFGLEYTILNRVRFRSLLQYGNQNKLSGDAQTTSLWLDLSYFY